MKHANEIIIDEVKFQKFDLPNEYTEGFLFSLGEIFICPCVLEKFSTDVIIKRIQAHARRQIGEYNQWLMTDEEKSNIELFFRQSIEGKVSIQENELVTLLKTLLTPRTMWILKDVLGGSPNLPLIKKDLMFNFPTHEANRIYGLIESYINPPDSHTMHSQDDFWEQFIIEEKSLESIENEETIDSIFLDRMVIMTTPQRRATIIYMENKLSRVFDFYKLDEMLTEQHA